MCSQVGHGAHGMWHTVQNYGEHTWETGGQALENQGGEGTCTNTAGGTGRKGRHYTIAVGERTRQKERKAEPEGIVRFTVERTRPYVHRGFLRDFSAVLRKHVAWCVRECGRVGKGPGHASRW